MGRFLSLSPDRYAGYRSRAAEPEEGGGMRPVTTPRRCRATTRKGTICAITSSSTMKDELGRDVAEPLRRGGNHCVFHARPFCTIPAEFTGKAIVLLLDLFRNIWVGRDARPRCRDRRVRGAFSLGGQRRVLCHSCGRLEINKGGAQHLSYVFFSY